MTGRWIIYPETKFVPETKLRVMLTDAIDNGEVSNDISVNEVYAMPLYEVCNILSDIGSVTFVDVTEDESLLKQTALTEKLLEQMERE